MSDPTPAAQALDEDLRLLMHDTFGASNTVKERVWGPADPRAIGRTVEESRALYRRPIVEAFQASGAETLAEFPERVRDLLERAVMRTDLRTQIEALKNANDALNAENARLLHERDMAMAEADRHHVELTQLREGEHKAQQQLRTVIGIKEKQATELDESEHKAGVLRQQLVNLREECTRLYAVETRLTRRVRWAMARIEDLLLKGDA